MGQKGFLITKSEGADGGGLAEIKAQAAHRWCATVNHTAEFGQWEYVLARSVRDLTTRLDEIISAHPAAA
jgi:type III restriction enzyme